MFKFISKSCVKRFITASLIVGASGCSNFLDENDPSSLEPENFYTIPDHAEAAVAATYAGLRFYGDGAGIFSANWQMLEAVTGTATTQTGQNSDLNNLYSLTYDGNTAHINNWWNGLYRITANANLALDKIPGIVFMAPATEAQKTRLLGEARFLRAWAYFNIVRLLGRCTADHQTADGRIGRFYAVQSSSGRDLQTHRRRLAGGRSGGASCH